MQSALIANMWTTWQTALIWRANHYASTRMLTHLCAAHVQHTQAPTRAHDLAHTHIFFVRRNVIHLFAGRHPCAERPVEQGRALVAPPPFCVRLRVGVLHFLQHRGDGVQDVRRLVCTTTTPRRCRTLRKRGVRALPPLSLHTARCRQQGRTRGGGLNARTAAPGGRLGEGG